MYWIKCIKSIFGYTALYESSLPIILEDNKRCKYRSNYPIAHHNRQGKKHLNYPAL